MINRWKDEAMMKSMTGFGRGEAKDSERQFVVEIKSVNHKFNDILVRLPRKLTYLEEKIKSLIKEEIKRGRVEVHISLENIGDSDTIVSLNQPLAEQYINCLRIMKERLDILDDISVSLLAKFPDVLKITPKEEDEQAVWCCLEKALMKALETLMEMRVAEGKKLAEDICERCDYILKIVKQIENRAPQVVFEYRQKLRERISELLEDNIEIDEQRLSMEVALFADKSNITEEIVRLKSHLSQLKKSVEEKEPIGRKLDFLIQEMIREINTIGSKASDLEITNHVVDIKSELEKIREQAQNIE